jgi:phenylacetate-coenzyme A ligase PaaK-like adenylate-forming protein
MLIAYASLVRLLAEAQLVGQLMIMPRFVFSASEVLTDSTRRVRCEGAGDRAVSRTMPLIRYEMSDSLQVGGGQDCPCGRSYALITGIQGREQQSLTFPTASGQDRSVQPIVFHHIMDSVRAAGWQRSERKPALGG